MTAAAFVYAPAMPVAAGAPPYQPCILIGLAVFAGVAWYSMPEVRAVGRLT
jgi:hypothetical protein